MSDENSGEQQGAAVSHSDLSDEREAELIDQLQSLSAALDEELSKVIICSGHGKGHRCFPVGQ